MTGKCDCFQSALNEVCSFQAGRTRLLFYKENETLGRIGERSLFFVCLNNGDELDNQYHYVANSAVTSDS